MLYDEILKMDDHINLNMPNGNIDITSSPATPFKYNEDEIVKELLDYIRGTYRQHYSAGDIIKILHYAVLLMHFNDKNAERETYPQ